MDKKETIKKFINDQCIKLNETKESVDKFINKEQEIINNIKEKKDELILKKNENIFKYKNIAKEIIINLLHNLLHVNIVMGIIFFVINKCMPFLFTNISLSTVEILNIFTATVGVVINSFLVTECLVNNKKYKKIYYFNSNESLLEEDKKIEEKEKNIKILNLIKQEIENKLDFLNNKKESPVTIPNDLEYKSDNDKQNNKKVLKKINSNYLK